RSARPLKQTVTSTTREAGRPGDPFKLLARLSKWIVRRNPAQRCPLAQEGVMEQAVPALLGQLVYRQAGESAGPGAPGAHLAHRFPLPPIQREEYLEAHGHAVGVAPIAVAREDHLRHLGRPGQLDLRPLLARACGDPTVVVAVLAVIKVRDGVDRIAG
ncbi:MAG: hypothetical protein ABIK62_07610, partial [candidate division WOR-3 bacterium]